MDRNKGQYGYPARTSGTSGQGNNTSIFGLISKVNKGILKNPIKDRNQPSSVPPNQNTDRIVSTSQQKQEFSPVEKPLYKEPEFLDKHKQDAFLLAKSRVEQLQKGLWKGDRSEKKPESSLDSFKVPQLPARSVRQSQDGRDRVQEAGQQGQAKSQVSLVEYEDDDNDDQPKRGGSFNREKALEEIDRYRVRGSGAWGAGEPGGSTGLYKEQTKEYETDNYYSSAHKKEKYYSSESDLNTKHQASSYEPYRKSNDDVRKSKEKSPLDDKHYSGYEVFDYGHSSDFGERAGATEAREKAVTRGFEDTNLSGKDKMDRGIGGYDRDYTGRNYNPSRSYEEELGNSQSESLYGNKAVESHGGEYGDRYQGGNQWDSKGKRSWEDAHATGRYSDEQGRGHTYRDGHFGQDRQSSYSGFPGREEYSRQEYRQGFNDPYNRTDGSRHGDVNPVDDVKYFKNKSEEKFHESYIEQPGNVSELNKNEKSRKGSGEMLYEDFLFGNKGDEEIVKREKVDESEIYRHFEGDRHRRLTEQGRKDDDDSRQRVRPNERQINTGSKDKEKYRSDDSDMSAADRAKPFYETRWASEKSETLSGPWNKRQRDVDDLLPVSNVTSGIDFANPLPAMKLLVCSTLTSA